MPKIKTRSAAKKRFSKTNGSNVLIKRAKAGKRHLLTKKGEKRKRHLKTGAYVDETQHKTILKMLPY